MQRFHNKTYFGVAGRYARYHYAYNLYQVNNFNNYAGSRNNPGFTLAVNQFSDISTKDYTKLFPLAQSNLKLDTEVETPKLNPNIPTEYHLNNMFSITVEDQGYLCSSGWAYALAKAIEIRFQLFNSTNEDGSSRMSAQNLIDCAGKSKGCSGQHPLTALQYLTEMDQEIYTEDTYKNDKYLASPQFCVKPTCILEQCSAKLATFGRVAEGDDLTLKQLIAGGYPVVIEYDPTSFEFMHYKSGIYTPQNSNKKKTRGSHFMLLVGYGSDNGVDYWKVLNSFGPSWGMGGYINIVRSDVKPLTKTALYPVDFTI